MWKKEAITDGEIDALRQAALAACNDDTVYPLWRGSHLGAGGECYNIASWLVSRLGGHVGRSAGHYVWLSADDSYVLDLTGAHHGPPTYAPNNVGYHATEQTETDRTRRFRKRADRTFAGLDRLIRLGLDYAGDAYPAEEPQAADDSDRFNDSWNDPEQNYWHDEASPTTPEGLYQFVYANGQLEVSPNHSHDELAGHAGVDPAGHTGPFAAGHVAVTNGKATWEVQANVNLHSMFRIFKDATKNYGWVWGGMTDSEGQPLIEDFAPKKSAITLHYAFDGEQLYLGAVPPALLALSSGVTGGRPVTGTLRVLGGAAIMDAHGGGVEILPALFEWAADNGLTLYAGNDNVIKTIPDLQEGNNYDTSGNDSRNPMEQSAPDERLPAGLYKCPGCDQLFPNWHEYQKHRREQESWGDPDRSNNGDRGLPEPDPGQFGDGAHFTEMRQEPGITTGHVVVLPARSWKEAARVDGFAKYAKAFGFDNDSHHLYVAYRNGDPLGYAAVTPDGGITMLHAIKENQGIGQALYSTLTKQYRSLYTNAAHDKTTALLQKRGWVQSNGQLWRWSAEKAPTDMLDASVPFIYDVDSDKIFVGHPGARTSDIPGKFTPGGIVEGTYEPGGKVIIRSLTSIPYTVRHMIELWYYTHPELEVKSVHLKDDAGKDTKLASQDIGTTVRTYAAMDPAVQTASSALQQAGGQVFAVGGAVRDAVLGKEPDDIDLMVTGLPFEKVNHLLELLPGTVVHEGKSFGIFHYHLKGSEVHIALPRTEQSTGEGHKHFTTQSDHTMSPEQDFARRDFTANAIGVNLGTGEIVDPYGGRRDIESGTLRTLSPQSLAEDPLRVVRAIVANAKHGLTPDENTRAQMAANADGLTHLPAERIQHELDKLMASDNPARAIRLAHETGVLKHILPEVDAAFGYDQNNPHHEKELGDHLLSVLDRASRKTKDPDLRLAALLHDIGKPASAWKDPETGTNHYYEEHRDGTILGADHEKVGAEMATQRMKALKYPTDRTTRVSELISGHMWPAFTTSRGARRFLHRVGDHADDLFTLRWADQGGKSAYPTDPSLNLDTQRRLTDQARNAGEATTQSQLAINGNDLIAAGIEPGPIMGQILNHLTDQVVDDPTLNNPATLLQLAQDYARIQQP